MLKQPRLCNNSGRKLASCEQKCVHCARMPRPLLLHYNHPKRVGNPRRMSTNANSAKCETERMTLSSKTISSTNNSKALLLKHNRSIIEQSQICHRWKQIQLAKEPRPGRRSRWRVFAMSLNICDGKKRLSTLNTNSCSKKIGVSNNSLIAQPPSWTKLVCC